MQSRDKESTLHQSDNITFLKDLRDQFWTDTTKFGLNPGQLWSDTIGFGLIVVKYSKALGRWFAEGWLNIDESQQDRVMVEGS